MNPYYFRKKGSKYRNKKVVIDGVKFDSKRESERYKILKAKLNCGLISGLELQPGYLLQEAFFHEGKKIRSLNYNADFRYYDKERKKWVIEDVKGFKTKEYLIKRKLFLHGLEPGTVFLEIY